MKKKLRFLISLGIILLQAGTAFAQEPIGEDSDPYWQATYWNNTELSGSPMVQENVSAINWDWGNGSPHSAVSIDRFSARWERIVDVLAGTYRFTATSDDGIRVIVDGQRIIDHWDDHAAQTDTADIELIAGHHKVVVEYYENRGQAVAKLSWAAAPASDQWVAEYFNNRHLSGTPTMVREEEKIDWSWATGSPDHTINRDNFSARWTRLIDTTAGNFRFTATSDDGIRVTVDNQRIIDHWNDHAAQTDTADITLQAGTHWVVVEYYENRGHATAKLSWAAAPTGSGLWAGEYYANRTLSGTPALLRDEEAIEFYWAYGSPASNIPSDGFSARWIRQVDFEPGIYRFTATSDDGVRLWLDHHLLINSWHDQPFQASSGTAYVSGYIMVRMEYYENGGAAAVKLEWESVDDNPIPPGDGIIVDDTDPGFVSGGPASGWRTALEGYNNHLTWTWNNSRSGSNYNWARWYPDLSPGVYEVFVYIPDRYTTTAQARYWISHRYGYTLRIIDQSANGGRWVSLGEYEFRGTQEDYVSLADVTYESYASRLVAFDAVKWVRQ